MGSSDKTQQQQLTLQNQLQQQQQSKQNQIIDQNQGAFGKYLNGDIGFSPAQLAALNSQALDQNALRYGQATRDTNTLLAGRGENGMAPLSGVAASGYGSLQAAKAGDLSDALRTVTLNDAQQSLTNKFNAGSLLSGNAQTLAGNVGTYGSGASNALNNVTQAQSNGFLSQFARGVGSGLGSGAAAGLTGGLGTAVSKVGSGNYGW